MTTSEIITRMARLGYTYDEQKSSSGNYVCWYTVDGFKANQISFASLRSALKFAEDR